MMKVKWKREQFDTVLSLFQHDTKKVNLLAWMTGFRHCWTKGSYDSMRNQKYLPTIRPEEKIILGERRNVWEWFSNHKVECELRIGQVR